MFCCVCFVFLFFFIYLFFFFFFFFSSRRRHTRLTCDWSSDVCSSDLPVRTERVVLLALVRIGQDGIRLVDVLEPPLRRLVTGFDVRVVLPGQLAEGLPDLGLAGCPGHPQDPVVVLVFHSGPPSLGVPSPSVVASDDDRWLVRRRREAPSTHRTLRLRPERGVAFDDLWRLDLQRLRLAPQSRLEHLVHRVDQDQLHLLADFLGDVPKVLLVLARQDHDL